MITLFNGYVITADENCYILGKLQATRKNGKIVERIGRPSYYGTLHSALQGFIERQIRESVATNDMEISDVLRELNSLSDYIKEKVTV